MFVETGYKKVFLENLVKDHNAKKITNNSHIYTNSKKILWVPNIGQKLGKNLKR